MTEARILDATRRWLVLLLIALAMLSASRAEAQANPIGDANMRAELSAAGPPVPGETWMLALHFTPRSPEWHGYWSNPGDAGLGMTLDWRLPAGWTAGEPLYPVPSPLVIGGLMNHIYEGSYAVLVPIAVPAGARPETAPRISVTADYLACTDKICVPQRAVLGIDPSSADGDPRFDRWRAAIAPLLDRTATFEFAGDRLRIGIPLPADAALGDPHLFLGTGELGAAGRPDYAAAQTFRRQGDLLVAEVPLDPAIAASPAPEIITGIVALDEGRGLRFVAAPGDVPLENVAPLASERIPALPLLLLAALAGGLLLNVLPCVFPILSLKALALARAGRDEAAARRDALAYTAGAVLACIGLGAALLVLRAGGEQVGWAFQLQEPGVLVALFLLATAITANFLGLYQIPGVAISGSGMGASSGGSFVTGLLAAFVATPCTGPFMAAALGAALLLPPLPALALFACLGFGLALPFLLLGFVPALRLRLPQPGPWMVRFRRAMALPMALTALALAWLLWRVGGTWFLLVSLGIAVLVVALLAVSWGAGRNWPRAARPAALALVAGAALLGLQLPERYRPGAGSPEQSLLDPLPFSRAALAEARASGRPVFVWFTADWCVTCKVNENVAIERAETRAAFERAGVVTLRGDWTLRDEEIAGFLAEQGAAGVPLYLWYPPGGDARQLPQVLTPNYLVELARSSSDSSR